nr:hypothetical protein [uncultured Actinoplanes sp.]
MITAVPRQLTRPSAAGTDRLVLEVQREALRRLGALTKAPLQALFDAVAEQAGRIVGRETDAIFQTRLSRLNRDGSRTVVARWGPRSWRGRRSPRRSSSTTCAGAR